MSADRLQWTPTEADSQNRCRNCGNDVTPQFSRVFGDNGDIVHACPDCTTYREMQQAAYHVPEGGDGQ